MKKILIFQEPLGRIDFFLSILILNFFAALFSFLVGEVFEPISGLIIISMIYMAWTVLIVCLSYKRLLDIIPKMSIKKIILFLLFLVVGMIWLFVISLFNLESEWANGLLSLFWIFLQFSRGQQWKEKQDLKEKDNIKNK